MPTMTQAGYRPPEQPVKKAPKPQPPKKKKKHKKKKRAMSGAAIASLVVFALCALIGAGTLFVYAATKPYQQAFLPGTMIMGYPLGGATKEDAQALIDTIEKDMLDVWQMEISCMNQTYTLTAEDVALDIDREATLAQLWEVGREGGMLSCYLAMQRLAREPMAAELALSYDLSAVDALLERMAADVNCNPVDATVTFTPGSAAPFVFTDDQTGYTLHANGVRARVEEEIARLTSTSIALEPEVTEPKVYRAVLENAIVVRSRLTVTLEGDDAGTQNAALAVRALNGARIEAGEIFSFNEVVGRRTEENGYVQAKEPAYGADAVGIGGGVCQASTLLYRAALLAGIEVEQRSAAARPVDYCEMGQEAAVSDQGLDLVLRNQTDTPLFVMARTYESDKKTLAEITIIGERLDERYALESLSEETGMITEPVYVRDRDGAYATYSDERVPVGEALMGYAAGVSRVTLDESGRETAREFISENVYEAVPPTIYVGVQERETTD